MRAILLQRPWEAFGWFVLLLALPANSRILELLRVFDAPKLRNLFLCTLLSAALTWLLVRFRGRRWRFAALLVPVAAMFALVYVHGDNSGETTAEMAQIRELADWAERNTWGSSMFLFPDAGKTADPGAFRAESRRAVWADWASGVVVDYSEASGVEWRSRWRATMEGPFSAVRLQSFLTLPIDYYVLKRQNQIDGVRAVFTNEEFTVYDAQDLRDAPKALRPAR
jgi:hypothetical protein